MAKKPDPKKMLELFESFEQSIKDEPKPAPTESTALHRIYAEQVP